ncbi:hypothetical protein CJ195_23890 [Bacillus sp. UMB0899]|nr:hypothetical protein CJ195_23890 [Bacillus sp. UMB0899]
MFLILILLLGYNYLYDALPIQIEILGLLGFYLTLPLSVAVIILSVRLIRIKKYEVFSYVSLSVSILLFLAVMYSLFNWSQP